jgi:hypothetical protein
VLPTAIMWRAFRDLLRMCVPELGWLCHSPSIRGMMPTSWSFCRYARHSSANLVMSSSACSISSICHPQHLVMRIRPSHGTLKHTHLLQIAKLQALSGNHKKETLNNITDISIFLQQCTQLCKMRGKLHR